MGNKQTERSKSEKTSQRQTDNRIAENVNKVSGIECIIV